MKRKIILALVVLVSVVLTSCGGEQKATPEPSTVRKEGDGIVPWLPIGEYPVSDVIFTKGQSGRRVGTIVLADVGNIGKYKAYYVSPKFVTVVYDVLPGKGYATVREGDVIVHLPEPDQSCEP